VVLSQVRTALWLLRERFSLAAAPNASSQEISANLRPGGESRVDTARAGAIQNQHKLKRRDLVPQVRVPGRRGPRRQLRVEDLNAE
jgi:hypothetical protein